MAQRDVRKANSKPTVKGAVKGRATPVRAETAAKSAAAKPPVKKVRPEDEIAQLTQALKDAEVRIAELERQRDTALDRIEWVLDSLHSLRDEQG
jgi:hypothetical protein